VDGAADPVAEAATAEAATAEAAPAEAAPASAPEAAAPSVTTEPAVVEPQLDTVTAPAPVTVDLPEPEAPPVRRPVDGPAPVTNPAAAYLPTTEAPAAPVATAVVASPRPVEAPQLAEQVVSKVGPLVDHGDGTYEIAVELQPAELGRVRVEVLVDHGRVSLTVHAQHATTSDVIREALPDLRAALEAAGLTAGDVLVDSGHAHGDAQPGAEEQGEPDAPMSGPAASRDPEHGSRPRPLSASTSAVDLLL
jgi:flagellar hook-length control protein FliK